MHGKEHKLGGRREHFEHSARGGTEREGEEEEWVKVGMDTHRWTHKHADTNGMPHTFLLYNEGNTQNYTPHLTQNIRYTTPTYTHRVVLGLYLYRLRCMR